MFASSQDEIAVIELLGRELTRYRFARNERQGDLAARLGISIPTYRRMERGCGRVPIAYWMRVLSLLDHLKGFETALGLNTDAASRNVAVSTLAQRVRRANEPRQ